MSDQATPSRLVELLPTVLQSLRKLTGHLQGVRLPDKDGSPPTSADGG